jgi:predicted alpha/beta-fold hydrolase
MIPFEPLLGLSGGHRQTLAGHIARIRLEWRRRTKDILVDGPDEVRLLVRASWQSGPRKEAPALLLIHGLEGDDRSGYVLSMGELAYRSGYHVVRMNMRGCGDSLRICPRLYNAGLSTDLLAVVERLSSEVSRLAICGFSLGANLALLTLALHKETIPESVASVVAVSPALDLAAAADWIASPRNRLYQMYFLRKLKRSYRLRQSLRPELYAPNLERGRRSIRDYDDVIIAPYGGYEGAADYYARASAGPKLRLIDRATLVLAASDDPMIPIESITRWPRVPTVRLEVSASGGHVGFVGKTIAPGKFWAAERALAFIDNNI